MEAALLSELSDPVPALAWVEASMDFGDRVKSRRLELDMTQEELAKKVNRTKGSISHWERLRTTPDPDTVQLLSIALVCDAAWLQWGDGAAAPPSMMRVAHEVDRGGSIVPVDLGDVGYVRIPATPSGIPMRAIHVHGSLLEPIYRMGDTVFVSVDPVPIEELYGLPAVVRLPRGNEVLRIVQVSAIPGRVTLATPNGHVLADVEATMAFPVIAVVTSAEALAAKHRATQSGAA
jgi:transcriptional regulator with XRE-family HTH domain